MATVIEYYEEQKNNLQVSSKESFQEKAVSCISRRISLREILPWASKEGRNPFLS